MLYSITNRQTERNVITNSLKPIKIEQNLPRGTFLNVGK